MPREKQSSGPGKAALPGADHYRCSWRTHGHPCLLPGEASRGLGERTAYYCGWHFSLLDSPRYQDDREEFERFVQAQRGAFTLVGALVTYCNVWAHWSTDELWAAARGALSLSLTGVRAPSPCAAENCPHRPRPPDRRATREESLAGISACIKAIGLAEADSALRTRRLAATVEKVVENVPF